MILTCPSCSAKYIVPPEAISEKGRDVRCKKCQHTWFQKSEEGERLDDLITRIQSEDIDEDDISFRDAMANSSDKRNKTRIGAGILARLKSFFAKKKNETVSIGNPPFLKYFASGMTACAAVSLIIYSLVMLRGAVIGVIPAAGHVYEQLGFATSPYADVNPEESLILEKVEMAEHGDQKWIKGNIINLTPDNIRLPKIRVSFKDSDGAVIKEDRYVLSQPAIGKEMSVTISLPLKGNPPDTASHLEMSFVE